MRLYVCPCDSLSYNLYYHFFSFKCWIGSDFCVYAIELFNAKDLSVKKTVVLIFNSYLGGKADSFLTQGINPKVNVIPRVVFDLAYNDVVVKALKTWH